MGYVLRRIDETHHTKAFKKQFLTAFLIIKKNIGLDYAERFLTNLLSTAFGLRT